MKEKNKGFTLIELLAVIVVLAIIMVIATTLVSKQIKKSKKNANEINKEMIVKAVKTCLVENTEEECDTIEKLQKNGYLDSFEDPWNKKNDNLDDSYTIVISDDDARVIYFGEGITEEVETPPNEYFSWCNSDNGKHTCTDGLTSEGKKWLQGHDDILIFPSTIKTIKDCESTGKNCTNFSGVNIDALIITSKISVNANFSNSTINVVRIDSGSIGDSKFKNSIIKNFVIGNAEEVNIGGSAFAGSKINNFTMQSGSFSRWNYGFENGEIGTLTIGDGNVYFGTNAFNATNIKEIIIKTNSFSTDTANQAFRFNNYNCDVYLDKNRKEYDPSKVKKIGKITIKSNVNKLPKSFIANNIYVRYIAVGELVIEGDKNRFSVQDLYDAGFNCDKITSALNGSSNEIDVQTCRNMTSNGKITTENCRLQ